MIARMATSGSKAAAGSVGTVETQFLDLPTPLTLDCGRTLHPVRIAYETYGTLSPARDNVILVCHALSGDAHAAGFAKTPPPESTRDGFAAEDRDGSRGRRLIRRCRFIRLRRPTTSVANLKSWRVGQLGCSPDRIAGGRTLSAALCLLKLEDTLPIVFHANQCPVVLLCCI